MDVIANERAPAQMPTTVAADTLGRHIREARTARGFTLEQLAQRTGLSRSYLSNVERDVNSPTISTLRIILGALGLSLTQLFRNIEAEPRPVVRPADRVEVTRTGNNANRFELLNRNPTGRIEMMLMHVAPGASSGETPHTHTGEEVGLVISGRLRYWVQDACYDLEEGDAISFESIRPHRYENLGDEPCVSVWALTPPSF